MFAVSLGQPCSNRSTPPVNEPTRLLAFSLFAGAGGLDLGVERAGFSVVAALENDANAVDTLNINRQRCFTSLADVRPVDITVADPKIIMRAQGLKAEIEEHTLNSSHSEISRMPSSA